MTFTSSIRKTIFIVLLTLIVEHMYAINCFTVTVAVYYYLTPQYCSLSILVILYRNQVFEKAGAVL